MGPSPMLGIIGCELHDCPFVPILTVVNLCQLSLLHMLSKEILTGDSVECQIPGGWGAAGSPNDRFHQFLHVLTKTFAKTAVSSTSDFDLRAARYQLQQSVQSSLTVKCFGAEILKFVDFSPLNHCTVKGERVAAASEEEKLLSWCCVILHLQHCLEKKT